VAHCDSIIRIRLQHLYDQRSRSTGTHMGRFKLKVRDTSSDLLLSGRVGVSIEVDIGVRDVKNFG